jgi:hypothetical protein
MKLKQVEFIHAVTIPGTEILAAPTISRAKHPGVRITIVGTVVMIEGRATGIVPLSNVRSAILDAEEPPKASKK